MIEALDEWGESSGADSSEEKKNEPADEPVDKWTALSNKMGDEVASDIDDWQALGSASPRDDSNNLLLPEARAALFTALPAPLRFMDYAVSSSYVTEGAPVVPSGIMTR